MERIVVTSGNVVTQLPSHLVCLMNQLHLTAEIGRAGHVGHQRNPGSLYLDKVRGVLEQAGVNVDSVSSLTASSIKAWLYSIPSLRHVTKAAWSRYYSGGAWRRRSGDLTGFAAASYQRGVRFIQVRRRYCRRSIPPLAAKLRSTIPR